MRQFLPLFIILLSAQSVSAQMDISEPTRSVSVIVREEQVEKFEVNEKYFSEAKDRADRIAARKSRNDLEISPGIEASLNTLNSAWMETSGGDNTLSGSTSLYLKHKYHKNRLTIESSLTAVFGYYRVNIERTDDNGTYKEAVWYKNQDAFSFSVSPSMSMSKNWAYGASMSFRSQFAKGYVSSASQEDVNLKSSFLSPGYLNMSLGVNYNCPKEKFPLKLTISPLAINGIFVKNEKVRQNAIYQYKTHEEGNWKYTDPYGVSPYESSKFEGGSSLQINFDRTFGNRATVRYITSIFSFYGWISNVSYDNIYKDYDKYKTAIAEWESDKSITTKPLYAVMPTVRWTNRVELKATRLLYTNLNFELYYDRAQNTKVQTKTLLSLGVSYKFTNKS